MRLPCFPQHLSLLTKTKTNKKTLFLPPLPSAATSASNDHLTIINPNGQLLLPWRRRGRPARPRRGCGLEQTRGHHAAPAVRFPQPLHQARQVDPHGPGPRPAHGGRPQHVHHREGAGAGPIRRDVPLHEQADGRAVRLQDDREEEAGEQGGHRGREEGGADHVPPDGAGQHCGAQGGLRGQAFRAPRHGAVRGRGALRPDYCQGPLHGTSRCVAAQDYCADCAYLSFHGGHP